MILTSRNSACNSLLRGEAAMECGSAAAAPIAAAQRPSDDSQDSLGKQRGTTRVGAAWCSSCPTSFTREQARGGLGGSWRFGRVGHHWRVRVAVLFSQRLGLTAASRGAKAAEPHSTAAAPRRRQRDHKHEAQASDSPANRSSVFERREGTAAIRRSCSEIRDQNGKIAVVCRRGPSTP